MPIGVNTGDRAEVVLNINIGDRGRGDVALRAGDKIVQLRFPSSPPIVAWSSVAGIECYALIDTCEGNLPSFVNNCVCSFFP